MSGILEFFKDIYTYGLPSLTVCLLYAFFYLLTHPEKAEKWAVLLYKLIYWVTKHGSKKIIAYDIQGRVNEFSKALSREIPNFEPKGISIEWIEDKESPEEFSSKNRLIIRMRHHSNQDKNFVYASMAFISNTILTKAKKYLAKYQKESLDLFVGRKLMDKEKPHIACRFFEDFFSIKVLSDKRIMELLEKYEIIDKVGLFFPVLVQEISFLGEKVFYGPRSEKIIIEVSNFISFLNNYANRDIGEETIPKNFEGAYCRCGIVIIAKSVKRATGNVDPYIYHIKKLIDKKLENIYLIGSSSGDNRSFMEQISYSVKNQFGWNIYYSKEYKSKIKIKGDRQEVDNYLILLRSPMINRVYDREYHEKFIEPCEGTQDGVTLGTDN